MIAVHPFTGPGMDLVGQIDQLAMFMVYSNIADTEFQLPLEQFHRNPKPPVSARNVIVK